MWLMTSIPFFLNTWEEFYTGELNLPIVHGVSEGTLTACIAMALTGYYGLEFWNQEANILGLVLKYNEITTLFCFITGMFFALLSLMNVILKYKEKRRDVFLNLIIFLFLVLSLVIVVNYADSIIVEKYPKIIIILYGFAFSKLVGHLQLAHICDSEFMQYRKSLLISFAWLSIVALLKHFYAIDVVNIDNLIIILLILNIIVWVHFAYYVTEELCDLLGINRFTLKKRNKLD
jgi:ethanolaminephosphotransferase